jgi:hypothetical protein
MDLPTFQVPTNYLTVPISYSPIQALGLAEHQHEGVSISALRPLTQQSIQFILMGFAPEQGCKAFLLGPGQVLHHMVQRLPLIISVPGDGAPAVVAPTAICTMQGSGVKFSVTRSAHATSRRMNVSAWEWCHAHGQIRLVGIIVCVR